VRRRRNARPVTVPVACTLFPAEPYPIARRWAERRFNNLISWNEMSRGGHYPGWEQPNILVAELRSAFGHVRGSLKGEA
jgi:epoxide hydrolase